MWAIYVYKKGDSNTVHSGMWFEVFLLVHGNLSISLPGHRQLNGSFVIFSRSRGYSCCMAGRLSQTRGCRIDFNTYE